MRNLSPNPVHVLQGQGTQILGSGVGGFGVRLALWASRAWSVSGWSQWDLCARRWGGWGSVCTQPCPWGLSVAVPCLWQCVWPDMSISSVPVPVSQGHVPSFSTVCTCKEESDWHIHQRPHVPTRNPASPGHWAGSSIWAGGSPGWRCYRLRPLLTSLGTP